MARVRIRVPVYRVSTTGRIVRKGTKTRVIGQNVCPLSS